MGLQAKVIGFLLMVIITGGLGFFAWYNYDKANDLETQIEAERQRAEIAEQRIDKIKQSIEENERRLNLLADQNRQIAADSRELNSLLSKHDLSYLAAAKPGLIERRANDATDEVFQTLRDISKPDWKYEEPSAD